MSPRQDATFHSGSAEPGWGEPSHYISRTTGIAGLAPAGRIHKADVLHIERWPSYKFGREIVELRKLISVNLVTFTKDLNMQVERG